MSINFKKEMTEKINRNLNEKKKMKPYDGLIVGIGIRLNTLGIEKNGKIICEVEEINRVIEELQMLKDAIEEETGLNLND